MLLNLAEDALQRMKNCNPDVRLMDVRMPKMSGIELLKHLKTRA
jgi:CheY-like chemotaxis protein